MVNCVVAKMRCYHTQRYKLIRPYFSRGSRLQDSMVPAALYNLSDDPQETTNVAALNISEQHDLSNQRPELQILLHQQLDSMHARRDVPQR